MKRFLFLPVVMVLFTCCTPDYSKDIVGWWASEDSTPEKYKYYIIRDDGTYKERTKVSSFGVPLDMTYRGQWNIEGSIITFNATTYNDKEQHSLHIYKIKYLNNKKLILETEDGNQFVYLNTDNSADL